MPRSVSLVYREIARYRASKGNVRKHLVPSGIVGSNPTLGVMDHITVFETRYWTGFLSDRQHHPGRLYIQLNRDCSELSDLTRDEWDNFEYVVKDVEKRYKGMGATMFNWTCLMNDGYKPGKTPKRLHWHCRPRFKKPVTYEGITFTDPNFGHHYDREGEFATETPREMLEKIGFALTKLFSK